MHSLHLICRLCNQARLSDTVKEYLSEPKLVSYKLAAIFKISKHDVVVNKVTAFRKFEPVWRRDNVLAMPTFLGEWCISIASSLEIICNVSGGCLTGITLGLTWTNTKFSQRKQMILDGSGQSTPLPQGRRNRYLAHPALTATATSAGVL